jgi:AraC-like DNA-binding protein
MQTNTVTIEEEFMICYFDKIYFNDFVSLPVYIVFICIDGDNELTVPSGAKRGPFMIGIIAPLYPTKAVFTGTKILIFLFEVDSVFGFALKNLLANKKFIDLSKLITPTTQETIEEQLIKLNEKQLVEFLFNEVFELKHDASPEFDPRISNVLNLIKKNPLTHSFRSTELAKLIFLSHSRFSRLFREQMGVGVKKYSQWLKIKSAIQIFFKRQRFVDVLNGSNFFNQSHLNRSFKYFFGIDPSNAWKRIKGK